jgi:erythromycin esterase-like protein/predicted phosphoribosyltransferase
VAYEVATALNAPLDIFVVRKLGAPGHEELAMGAIASGGVVVLNDDVVRALSVRPEVIRRVADEEWRELERRESEYRGNRPKLDVKGKTVIVVDDGLATGSSMRAAVRALRKLEPSSIVIAVPAAPSSTCRELAEEVDEVVCGTTPSPFYAVGLSYWDFTQTKDEEVRSLLDAAWSSEKKPGGGEARADQDVIRSHVSSQASSRHVPLPDVGNARFVLLGEATHGTYEFYEERARITRWLIEEKGFSGVAVEADWPDAYQVNRYVRGEGNDTSAEQALSGFKRFPTWMWRNTVVREFVEWLRERNESIDDQTRKAGFYGLDLYSLYSSMHEVVSYLERVDPAAAARARERYSCFDHFGEDAQSYGYGVAYGAGETCEREAVDQLIELHRNAVDYVQRDGMPAEDELFYAQQNARTVKAAEEYYRTLMRGQIASWNLRDRHMADTLEELTDHISLRRGEKARLVVWAHNSHLGDARSTELGMKGELNVGQLTRERHPRDAFLLGFTTYDGSVTAAGDWGGQAERMQVRPGLQGSFEHLLHEVGQERFLVDLRESSPASDVLRVARLERAIGVIYRPDTERQSHYFRARLGDQFDAVIHFDRTAAVEPLERSAGWEPADLPETYPHAV